MLIKKNFASRLASITEILSPEYSKVSAWIQDESRFGLMTHNGRSLTANGVKPVCPFKQEFKSRWLYGAFSPSEDSFMTGFPVCDSDCFQAFFSAFASETTDEFPILVLDNGAFHKAKRLLVPPNIKLLFLPPYSPELNPAEKVWAKFKRAFTSGLFKTIADAGEFIAEAARSLDNTTGSKNMRL